MPSRFRRIWLGVTVACVVAVAPSVLQAQEYLPPVIDRSSGVVQTPPAQQKGTAAAPAKATASLEERVKRLERLLDNEALVDMLMRLDSLQTQSQSMQGEIESLTHTVEGINQRQRDLYLDIDRRMRQLELSASRAAASPSSSAAASSGMAAPSAGMTTAPALAGAAAIAAAPSATVATDPAAEQAAYQKAFNLLKDGQYDQAITEFQTFLAKYPQGNYTDNAQYWLGEANYVTRRFDVAEQEFLKVVNQYPNSSKMGDAMLKLGYTYYELGKWDAARKTLDNVAARYPNTTVGRLAENRLQKMRLEGR